MKTRFKKTLIASAAAAAFGLSGAAGAVEFLFDADAGGTDFGYVNSPLDPSAGDYRPVNLFGLRAKSNYDVVIDTGVAGGVDTIDAGDTFTESILFNLERTVDSGGNTVWTYNIKPSGGGFSVTSSFVYFDVQLSGVISSYSGGADGPTSLACLGLGTCSVVDDVFDFDFTGGTIDIYYDDDATPGGDMLLASLTVTGGGADNFSFDNPTATADIGVIAEFDWVLDGVFSYLGGTDFADALAAGTVITALADASVNLEGVGGAPGLGTGGGDLIILTVSDNGTTARIPEPVSAALVGLGLLGIGGLARRRRRAS